MPGRFQTRVFLLIALVALAATGATAWLTLLTATAELSSSDAENRRNARTLYDTIGAYGRDHGTWEGIGETLRKLGADSGQRLQLTSTVDGQVVADTDQSGEGRERPVSPGPGLVIDVRPEPVLDGSSTLSIEMSLAEQMRLYREGVRYAACLTAGGAQVQRNGTVFTPVTGTDPAVATRCANGVLSTSRELHVDRIAARDCPDTNCRRDTFARRISEFAPSPVVLRIGYEQAPLIRPKVSARRTLLAAGGVALLAIAGTVLLSRRVLGQIADLSRASRRLAAGDLSERVPVRGDDEVAQLAHSFNQMADSLQASEERQQQMISDIAHELRTPLANIRGYVEAVQDGLLEPDPELFASLHEEAVLQQRLIDDLQELALAESGSLVYHRDRLDPAELLATCHTAHRAVAETEGVQLLLEPGDAAPVHADPDRLRQVIGNLITNALRATPAGGTVRLHAAVEAEQVLITVTDDGSGIAGEDLPHVFDRFWRADASRARTTGGRGLGLAIAREIVLAHGGEITVTSTPGERTCFAVRLPQASVGVLAVLDR